MRIWGSTMAQMVRMMTSIQLNPTSTQSTYKRTKPLRNKSQKTIKKKE
jgi:hypothetical protein